MKIGLVVLLSQIYADEIGPALGGDCEDGNFVGEEGGGTVVGEGYSGAIYHGGKFEGVGGGGNHVVGETLRNSGGAGDGVEAYRHAVGVAVGSPLHHTR